MAVDFDPDGSPFSDLFQIRCSLIVIGTGVSPRFWGGLSCSEVLVGMVGYIVADTLIKIDSLLATLPGHRLRCITHVCLR